MTSKIARLCGQTAQPDGHITLQDLLEQFAFLHPSKLEQACKCLWEDVESIPTEDGEYDLYDDLRIRVSQYCLRSHAFIDETHMILYLHPELLARIQAEKASMATDAAPAQGVDVQPGASPGVAPHQRPDTVSGPETARSMPADNHGLPPSTSVLGEGKSVKAGG